MSTNATEPATPGDYHARARAMAADLLHLDEAQRGPHILHLRRQDPAFAALVEDQVRMLVASEDRRLLDRAEATANSILGMTAARRAARLDQIRGESPVMHSLVVDCIRRRQAGSRPAPDTRADAVSTRVQPRPPHPSYLDQVRAEATPPEGRLFDEAQLRRLAEQGQYEPQGVLVASPTPELQEQLARLLATRPNMSGRVISMPRGNEMTVTDSAALRQARRIREMSVADRLNALEQIRLLDPQLYDEVLQLMAQMGNSFDGATLPAGLSLSIPSLAVLARQFPYIPDTHVPARIAAWIVLQPRAQHANLFPYVDNNWPPYGLQVRQEYLNFLNDNDYFAISRWDENGPLRNGVRLLPIDEAMGLVPESAATGQDSMRVDNVEQVAPDRFRATITLQPPADHVELSLVVGPPNEPSAEPRVSVPPVLSSAVNAYEAVQRVRRDQLARAGDWVQITESSRSFTKVANAGANLRPESNMGPGRPLTHLGTVETVEYRLDAQRNVMMECVTITLNGRTHEGRRVMPGVTDNSLMLPCAVPGCSRPHLNDHPFCRNHRTDDPSVGMVGTVERRLGEVQALAQQPDVTEETRTALTLDAAMLHEYVRDKQAVARRREQAEERRRREQAERERQAALAEEAKEEQLLQQLMAKRGMRMPARPPAGEGPVEGERNLEV